MPTARNHHLGGPDGAIVRRWPEPERDNPIQEGGQLENGEIEASGLGEGKIVLVGGDVGRRDEAAGGDILIEVVEATHMEQWSHGVHVDPGSPHVDNEVQFHWGNIEDQQLVVGCVQGSLVRDANTGGYESTVKVRGPNDDAHGAPHDHVIAYRNISRRYIISSKLHYFFS